MQSIAKKFVEFTIFFLLFFSSRSEKLFTAAMREKILSAIKLTGPIANNNHQNLQSMAAFDNEKLSSFVKIQQKNFRMLRNNNHKAAKANDTSVTAMLQLTDEVRTDHERYRPEQCRRLRASHQRARR